MSVPMQVIAQKDPYLKWLFVCWVWCKTLLTHSFYWEPNICM